MNPVKQNNGQIGARRRNMQQNATHNNVNNDLAYNHIQFTSMKIAHSNINSIRNKIDEISVDLSDYDVICISETKLNDQISTTSLLIDSYNNPIRKDRNINNGGGLTVYIKNNICYKNRPDLESDNLENIWVEIRSLKNTYDRKRIWRKPGPSYLRRF